MDRKKHAHQVPSYAARDHNKNCQQKRSQKCIERRKANFPETDFYTNDNYDMQVKQNRRKDLKLTPPKISSLANNSSNSSVALNLSSQRHRMA